MKPPTEASALTGVEAMVGAIISGPLNAPSVPRKACDAPPATSRGAPAPDDTSRAARHLLNPGSRNAVPRLFGAGIPNFASYISRCHWGASDGGFRIGFG